MAYTQQLKKGATAVCCAFLLVLTSCSGSKDLPPAEINRFYNFTPDVRVLVNKPAHPEPSNQSLLILFALPNGNTIEWTYGKKLENGDDWHYDIQHIAAQTRFLRHELPQYNVIVAYLEAKQKSWPAWRRKYPDNADIIARIVQYVRFETGEPQHIILSGHSGGGSFITGYINAYDSIPPFIQRISYLDANYSFDQDSLSHGTKLYHWLLSDTTHRLCVICYDDREIRWHGKKVVGPDGGTFRATKRMLQYFTEQTHIDTKQDSTIEQYWALDGRARFLVHTNPDTLILHTVLVERNGFIHSVLCDTPLDEKDYSFFGKRAYSEYIQDEIPWLKQP